MTAGLRIGAAREPRAVAVVPIPWATVGTSAALVIEITADLALAAAAVALAADMAMPRARLA